MIRPQRSPHLVVPLRYFLAGLAAWVLMACGVPLLATHLVAGYDDPEVFALTHLTVLGWVTMTIMGAMYQLFPVALQATISSPSLARWNFWVYLAGVSGFVPSFFFSWTPGMAIFGSLAVVGVICFATNLSRSYPSIRTWHPMAAYVLCGLGWLVVTLGFGLAWALDWQFNWFAISPNMLAAHVHAGLVGWLACTLMGVSYKLMELFALAHRSSWRLAYANLVAWNAGLVGLVVSLLFWPGSPAVTACATLLGLSAAVFAVDLLRMWKSRRRRAISLEQAYLAVSLASLLLAAALGIVIASGVSLRPNWVVAYGYVAIVGCFGFAVIGKYYKIIPFLIWLNRYGGTVRRGPVPLLKDLVDDRLGWGSFALLVAGYCSTLAGLLAAQAALVVTGGLVYLVGAVLGTGALGTALIPGRQIRRSSSRARALPGRT
ncbi:MAG: hypothetical protein WAO09_09375 [Candidatus Dormiibacterota bacterium]